MEMFLIVAIIIGFILSIINLYTQTYIYVGLDAELKQQKEILIWLGRNRWLSTTLPIISTVLLLVFWHWIFTIGIFISAFYYLYQTIGGIIEKRKKSISMVSREESVAYDLLTSIKEAEKYPILSMIPGIFIFISRLITAIGVSTLMAFSHDIAIWKLEFFLFLIILFLGTFIINSIVGEIIKLFVSIFHKK